MVDSAAALSGAWAAKCPIVTNHHESKLQRMSSGYFESRRVDFSPQRWFSLNQSESLWLTQATHGRREKAHGMATDDTARRPTKQQQLAAQLRRLRELAGMSGRDLAKLIDVSQSKVSRIESATTLPSLPEVTRWTKAVGAPAEYREWLAALAESVFTEVRGWRTDLPEQGHIQDEVEEREVHAEVVRTYQPSLI